MRAQPHLIKPPKPRFEDPRVVEAEKELGQMLAQWMGAPIGERLIKDVEDSIEEFRVTKLLQGVVLPRMRVMALPLAGYIQVWPADMEKKDFDIRLVMMIRDLKRNKRNHDPDEIAKAVRRAYPDYSPSLSIKTH